MTARRPWDADADTKLRLLFVDQKQSVCRIARQLGRTSASTRNRISVLRDDGLIPRRRRSGWSADDDAALIALRREGLTAHEIATRLNRTKHAIDSRVGFLDLTHDVPTPRTNLKPRPAAPTKSVTRACLCCGDKFASRGAGNRLCGVCRKLDAGPEPAIVHR